MTNETPEKRVFPSCCTSAYCGRTKCDGCQNVSILNNFRAWREQTAAVQSDPIWCPSVWTATKVAQ